MDTINLERQRTKKNVLLSFALSDKVANPTKSKTALVFLLTTFRMTLNLVDLDEEQRPL